MVIGHTVPFHYPNFVPDFAVCEANQSLIIVHFKYIFVDPAPLPTEEENYEVLGGMLFSFSRRFIVVETVT